MARARTVGSAQERARVDRIDLNLLHIFDVVMVERHVTRAAERLSMTQSAVSNALNRLRRALGDQLFVKAPRGVDPTHRATELWLRIHPSIAHLHESVRPPEFKASETRLKFRISVVDLMASLLAPHLHKIISTSAPHSAIHFIPHDEDLAPTRLIRSEVDIAIGVRARRLSVLQSIPLWSEPYVVVARNNHPLLATPLSLNAFCDAKHLVVNLTGSESFETPVDTALANRGLGRNVQLSVNQFSLAGTVLQDSDLLAVMPARFLSIPEARGLAARMLPIPVSDAVIYLTWHQRNSATPAHEWLKKVILESAHIQAKEMMCLLPKVAEQH